MPHNNPGRNGLHSGQTVFIDAPLELPTHLMHQDLETLVSLTDLEALQDAADAQVIDGSGVFLSDGVTVSNMVEVHGTDSDMDTLQSPEDTMPNNHLQELVGGPTQVAVAEIANANHKLASPLTLNKELNALGGIEQFPSQILKTNLGQFVILQPNQSQFRTIQLKQATSLSQVQNTGTVTKLIINNQPGATLTRQLRTVNSEHILNNNFFTDETNAKGEKISLPKVSLDFQPFGLTVTSKNVLQTTNKTLTNDANCKFRGHISFAIRPDANNVSTIVNRDDDLVEKTFKPGEILTTSDSQLIKLPAGQLSQPQLSNKIMPHCKAQSTSITNTIVTSPQKIIIKGSIPVNSFKPGQILAASDAQIIKLPSGQLPQAQTVQLSNKLNYVRLVSASPNESATNNIGTISAGQKKPLNQNMNIKTISMPTNMNSNTSVGNVQIRPPTSLTLPASALSPQVLSNAQPGSLVMIPAHYFQNNASTSSPQIIQVANQNPIPSKPQLTKTVIDANGLKPRKPCNCTKSQCLKLYCDCFTNGEFCFNCNCTNCFNNLDYEEERQKAIRSCLERNPNAFRPKIGKGGTQNERRHNKGCNCKRSGCLKNYCECYEAKIPCTNMCKCIGCRNIDSCQPPERKKLMQLAEIAEARVNQKVLLRNRPLTMSSLPSPVKMMLPSSGKSIHCRINQEVVEATCHCLLAQAEKKARANEVDYQAELMVIDEFSRCLLQIIGCNNKFKDL